jgi:hypothetical protein
MGEASTRRTDRIALAIPIRVAGADVTGLSFVEETKTVVVSRHGAKITLKRTLTPDQEINVRNIRTGKEADMRVIGAIAGCPDGIWYGLEFLNPSVDIWGINFPPLVESENAVAKVLLECARCHRRSLVYLDEFRVEVFRTSLAISLPCTTCKDHTLWKRPGSAAAPTTLAMPGAKPPPPPVSFQKSSAAPPGKQEGRREKHLSLRMQACIRTKPLGEVVVMTENLSRGGFSFKSPERFSVGEIVEVCVPYAPGAGNIFSSARIAHAAALPQGGVHSYGICSPARTSRVAAKINVRPPYPYWQQASPGFLRENWSAFSSRLPRGPRAECTRVG